MKTRIAVIAAAVALAACSKQAPAGGPAVPPPAQPPTASPAPPIHPPEPAPATVIHPPEPPPVAHPPEPKKGTTAVAPAPAARPAAQPQPTPASAHGKVGDAKCRMCHKLQHDSWSASPHAAKRLDCEGCHGGGADFMKVMRDRTAAIAAGLVLPKPEFCRTCHKKDWQDGMYLRVHAHKAK